MPIIGVIGRKGGCGKTTIAVHLAAQFASEGKSVALVDCDTQGSATYWSEPGNLPMPVIHLPLEHTREMSAWLRNVRGVDADVVVLDSPPHLNAALGGVIGLSDVALIPCGPSGLDLMATAETVGLVHEIRDERRDKKPKILLVPNRVDRRTSSGRDLEVALKDLKESITPVIGSRTAFSDAFNAGAWVGGFARNSVAHQEVQALAKRVWRMLKD